MTASSDLVAREAYPGDGLNRLLVSELRTLVEAQAARILALEAELRASAVALRYYEKKRPALEADKAALVEALRYIEAQPRRYGYTASDTINLMHATAEQALATLAKHGGDR